MDEQNNVSQQETVQEAPVQDNPEVSSVQTEKEKVRSSKNKKVWTLAALIAAAVVVVLAIAGVLVGVYRYNSTEAVAVRYVKALITDGQKADSLLAYDSVKERLSGYDGDETAFFEKAEETYDAAIGSWKEYYRVTDEYYKDYYEDLYGEYKETVKAAKTKNVSVKKLVKDQDYWLSELEESSGFDRDLIQEVKEITVKEKIKGEDEINRYTSTVIVVKMNGKWKVLKYDIEWE